MNMFVLTMLFPLLSFVILAISQGRFSRNVSAIVGLVGIGISTCIAIYVACDWYYSAYSHVNFACFQELRSWFVVDNLNVKITFRLDKLSLIMLLVITIVGFVIHMYAVWYMNGMEGYSRFFAYTNLFMVNMMILVLSDNLLLVYLGWEGVGLCSYLLIGFYYFNRKNGSNAIKAFIMTRFGDICLMCSFFMIYDQYHTLNLSELLQLDDQSLLTHMSVWISFMLLMGSVGKSAQLPLQSWLVNAMVGPTPVSALIHAATMVTSGVYLISRMHNFFLITPVVLYIISMVGSMTIVIFSCAALCQSNIKKILAYSTISQIGYMFLALGSKNWYGAIFHLITHAFFKALLFLSAGSLIKYCKNEQNIFKMLISYRSLPLIYACFLIGGASLSGFPVITAGFYSKELILSYLLKNNNYIFLFLGLTGVFLTSVYVFRMIFVVFHGKKSVICRSNYKTFQYFPLIILSLLSSIIGSQISVILMNSDSVVINNSINGMYNYEFMYLLIITSILVFFGIWVASYFWIDTIYRLKLINIMRVSSEGIIHWLVYLCYYGWRFDRLYQVVFFKPYLYVARKLSYYDDPIRIVINIVMVMINQMGRVLMYMENGRLNCYVIGLNIGVIILLIVALISTNI